MSSISLATITNGTNQVNFPTGVSKPVNDFLEFNLDPSASTTTTTGYTSLLWNTTPTAQSGFANYTTSKWSGSSFTPGALGLYLITINYNMSGSSSSNELIIVKNLTTANASQAYGTTKMLATNVSNGNSAVEGQSVCLFNVTNVTDYVNFVNNTNTGSSSAYCISNAVARNVLRITKL